MPQICSDQLSLCVIPVVQEEDPPLSSLKHSLPPSTCEAMVADYPAAADQSALQPPGSIDFLSAWITTTFDHLPQGTHPPPLTKWQTTHMSLNEVSYSPSASPITSRLYTCGHEWPCILEMERCTMAKVKHVWQSSSPSTIIVQYVVSWFTQLWLWLLKLKINSMCLQTPCSLIFFPVLHHWYCLTPLGLQYQSHMMYVRHVPALSVVCYDSPSFPLWNR